MARWKKPLRATFRWLRFRGDLFEDIFAPHIPASLKIMSGQAFVGLLLSIVPGLAHLIYGRFGQVKWFVFAWFLSLAMGVFLYGTFWGFALIGLAIALHAWIAFNHKLIKELSSPRAKVSGLAALLILLGLGCYAIRTVVFGDLIWGYTVLNIPYYEVEAGDCLLARQSLARDRTLPRGALVTIRPSDVHGYGGGYASSAAMIGQVISLPGEDVHISENQFYVNGAALDPNYCPVPQWLHGRSLSATVPETSYFLASEYHVYARGRRLAAADIQTACFVAADNITGRAIMIWFPVRRRGFIEVEQ